MTCAAPEIPAPLVMMLDRETAKIHWEMVAQVEPAAAESMPAEGEAERRPFRSQV